MKIEEAKKLLDDFKANQKEYIDSLEFIPPQQVKNLIEAARTVQRAEDAETIKTCKMSRHEDEPLEVDRWNRALETAIEKFTQGGDPLT